MKIKGHMVNLGQKVTLSELLFKIPSNEYDWYIFEIDAVGIAPDGMTMSEFEDFVLECDYGYKISWSKLLEFSKSISDLNNLILVSSTRAVTFKEYEESNSTLLVTLEVRDSSFWEVVFYNLYN
ncbi:hypothetical protein [Streptococcus suis]|uniref:hypothetical protein n=1 Tax=Streptococcus suis TaxID=1307 RepID=UPI001ABC6690|nr:hypothetical protein [Streptococcus suis]MBO3641477.1 hypothetical protein [Streptococcus suis]